MATLSLKLTSVDVNLWRPLIYALVYRARSSLFFKRPFSLLEPIAPELNTVYAL